MSEEKFTPGVWKAFKTPNNTWAVRSVYEDEAGYRCTAFPAECACTGQDNKTNAHLIAASKALFEALKEADGAVKLLKSLCSCRDEYVWGIQEKIDAALAKARGETPQQPRDQSVLRGHAETDDAGKTR